MGNIRHKRPGFILIGFFLAFTLLPLAAASPGGFTPINADNATQVQILGSLTDYREDVYYAYDQRLFSSDGSMVATDLKVWNLVSGQEISLGQHYVLAMSGDGMWAIITGEGQGTFLLDLTTGSVRLLFANISDGAFFSPDNALVATVSVNADSVQLWDVISGAEIAHLGSPRNWLPETSAVFSPDGAYLAWHSYFDGLQLWDVKANREHSSLPSVVSDFVFTKDSAYLLVSDYRLFEIWDVATSARVAHIERDGTTQVLISPDGQRIVLAGDDGDLLQIWDISDVTNIKLMAEVPAEYGAKAAFSPDSRWLVLTGGQFYFSCSRDGSCSGGSGGDWSETVQILDATTGEEQALVIGHESYVTDAVFNTDGSLLITVSDFEHTIRLWRWDGTAATELAQLPGEDFLLSPDGSTLLVKISDELLVIYGIATAERPTRPFVLPGRIVPSSVNVRAEPNVESEVIGTASGNVMAGGISIDGSYVYLPDYSGWVRSEPTYFQLALNISLETLAVLDPAQAVAALPTSTLPPPSQTPTTTPSPTATWTPGPAQVHITSAVQIAQIPAPPPGLESIAVNNVDQIRLLGVFADSSLRAGVLPTVVPTISNDGRTLITPPTYLNPQIKVWDLVTLSESLSPTLETDSRPIMAASPDGHLIVYGSHWDSTGLYLWDTVTGRQIGMIPILSEESYYLLDMLAFSPDSRMLAVSGLGTGIYLWDMETGEAPFTIPNSGNVIFSPDGSSVAVFPPYSNNGRVSIYDVSTGDVIIHFPPQHHAIDQVLFSPDGQTLATYGSNEVRLWTIATGEPIITIPVARQRYDDDTMAFSPDSQTFATLDDDGALRLWDVSTGMALAELLVSGSSGLAFSPNGELLAVGAPLQLIDLSTGSRNIVEGSYHGEQIIFTLDGASLLVDNEHSVMVFGIPSDIRPEWQPLTGEIVPSAVNVRAEPEADADVIGQASGDVLIGGRDAEGDAVYLPEADGWIWAAPEYLDLHGAVVNQLPIRYAAS